MSIAQSIVVYSDMQLSTQQCYRFNLPIAGLKKLHWTQLAALTAPVIGKSNWPVTLADMKRRNLQLSKRTWSTSS